MLKWSVIAVFWLVCASHQPLQGVEVTQSVAVEIEIVADSANALRARLQVAAGTRARDLMERLFQLEYVDSSRRFVVSIAGFKAPPREQKFWKLEIERLRWVITTY
jgi:hypothetical protein